LDDVDLRISFIWASDISLTYDLDCDGINETPLAQLNDGNTPVDSPMTVTTDKDGSYILNFDFISGAVDTDCDGIAEDSDADTAGIQPAYFEWNGTVQVTSGSLFSSAEFSVAGPSSEE
jgi:hypothetical protein